MLAAQIEDADDVERIFQDLRLRHIAGNAVEHQRVLFGMKATGFGAAIDEIAPEFNRRFVGHQLPAAGILDEDLANLAIGLKAAENIAASAMKEIGNRAEDFALGALARARSAEKQDGAIFHCTSLC